MAELFCGPGGLGLSAILASKNSNEIIQPIWANDIDEDTCSTYSMNLHNSNKENVVCAPVENINFEKIPDFDGLAFGFPCNDFSIVGEKKGIYGKYGPLYSFGVKAISIKSPKWFVTENVTGLESANNGLIFNKILEELEEAGIGYNLTAHKYKFEQYEVPQMRHRIIIVGIRKDLNKVFLVPKPIISNPNEYLSVKEALSTPPILENIKNNELTKQSPLVIERLMNIPAGENAWYKKLPEHLQLNVKGAKLSNIYKRLDPNKPSYTITGSGGGGTHVYHWSEPRALTNRERARLQSFPDNFNFFGNKESVRKQIGMAVPPRGGMHIFKALLKTLSGESYDYVYSDFGEKTNRLL